MERRLTTILAADLVKYSRLMAADEEGVISRLGAIRKDLIDPIIAEGKGNIIKTMGDGLLVEFDSPVNAVRTALKAQRELARQQASVPDENKLLFRVGINLGDVVYDSGEVLGDGVNIAARLESLAPPGGVCISRTVHDQVRGKLDAPLVAMGPQDVKNIPEPIEVWLVETGVARNVRPETAKTKRPSVAVLPFETMAADPGQDFLADGIVEDVITELCRFRSLMVIARNSTFVYKGTHKDVRQIARELDVQYIVEGSVRSAGNRLRVTAQLIEAETGAHLWADRWDRTIDDLFTVQDELTRAIVTGVEPEMGAHERHLARRKPTENLSAWEHYQRGVSEYLAMTEEAHARARDLLNEATAIDPQFVPAYAYLARIELVAIVFGWADDRRKNIERALTLARQAVDLDPRSDEAHRSLGFALLVSGQVADAIETLNTGIRLNPNNAALFYNRAQAHLTFPDPDPSAIEMAIQDTGMAMRLNPHDPLAWLFHFIRGIAFVLRDGPGDDENAVVELRTGSRFQNAAWPVYLSLAVALLRRGQTEEARSAIKAGLLRQSNMSVEHFIANIPLQSFVAVVKQHEKSLLELGLPRG